MLSYRHGFHAGNHADVLKHTALVALLRILARKDKPLLVVDTHAGAGMYSLEQGFAVRNAEFRGGIGALWERSDLPEPVADYLDQVRAVNPDGVLRQYPGSPRIALGVLRPQDRLRLFELHSTEGAILARQFAQEGRRVTVTAGDGFAGLKAVLPPPSRRGLVLIDPSYELATDYRAVVTALRDGIERFATGTYVVWYPLLQRRESVELPEKLRRAVDADWLDIALQVKAPSPDGLGLHGSGLFIVNPPWKYSEQMRGTLPWLARALAQDGAAGFRIDAHET
ncbi:MAG: 23S rRNA (adenine(2030)-N(6))-methyltransferase RlmJ [Steroidobacteraceae bacterium]|nr:23S rRNA (adenine(2030)-N(6))-methyltransferase RlmJ [Steroidobacteraceae bacterium]